MDRVYYRYEKWECYRGGMYRSVTDSEQTYLIDDCLSLMKDTARFKKAMGLVVLEWPHSCEHNLTNINQNPRAWIGQAAAAISINCPEHITRHCWGLLKNSERMKANRAADSVISRWRKNYEAKNWQIHLNMGSEGLFWWDTRRRRSEIGSHGTGPIIQDDMQGYT